MLLQLLKFDNKLRCHPYGGDCLGARVVHWVDLGSFSYMYYCDLSCFSHLYLV